MRPKAWGKEALPHLTSRLSHRSVLTCAQELALYSRYMRLHLTQMPGVWSSIGACTALTKLRIYADCDLTKVPLIVPHSHLCMLSGLSGVSCTGEVRVEL